MGVTDATGAKRHGSGQSWIWKLAAFAAAVGFLDALSILVPSIFGQLNFAHHDRRHGIAALIEGACFLGFAWWARQSRQARD